MFWLVVEFWIIDGCLGCFYGWFDVFCWVCFEALILLLGLYVFLFADLDLFASGFCVFCLLWCLVLYCCLVSWWVDICCLVWSVDCFGGVYRLWFVLLYLIIWFVVGVIAGCGLILLFCCCLLFSLGVGRFIDVNFV